MRQLLKKIDPSTAPTTQLSAWNIGPRVVQMSEQSQPAASIMNLLSQQQMTTLANVFFDKVDPCYGFIDQETLNQQIESRWQLPPYNLQSYDAVLCGVAALGSYFSKIYAVPVENQLVQLAKSMLDAASPTKAPEPETVTAWLCHVIYLRMTATPFAAWIASCNSMHILEAAGIHRHARYDTISNETRGGQMSQISRKAFGIAQHLNTWISYDVGLSRVSLQAPTVPLALDKDGNYTDKLLELLPGSIDLDRLASEDEEFLRSTLLTIVAKTDRQPPLVMAQCNLLLCVLRQLCERNLLRANDDGALESALAFLRKGLDAAAQMIEDDTPWHQLANIPFQTLCMLLAIDTPTSLRMVGDAMQTLQSVKNAYNTITLNEACNTACLILYLHRKRRWDDAQIIDNVLSGLITTEYGTPSFGTTEAEWTSPNEVEVSWFNDLLGGFPSLQTFNASDILDGNSLGQNG